MAELLGPIQKKAAVVIKNCSKKKRKKEIIIYRAGINYSSILMGQCTTDSKLSNTTYVVFLILNNKCHQSSAILVVERLELAQGYSPPRIHFVSWHRTHLQDGGRRLAGENVFTCEAPEVNPFTNTSCHTKAPQLQM